MDHSEIEQIIELAIERQAERNQHPDVCPLAPEDLVFVRTWRGRTEKIFMGIGAFLVVGILGGLGKLIYLGIDAWKGQ